MQLDLARLHGEEVSEFRAARVIAEYMVDDYIEMLDRGMPRSAIIEYLAHAACSSRKTAAVALWRVLKKAKYIPKNIETPAPTAKPKRSSPAASKAKIQAEVSEDEPHPLTLPPKPDPISAPAAQPTDPPKVEPVALVDQEVSRDPAELAAKPAESTEEAKPDKWARLGVEGVVGRGFLGEEHRWMTPEEIKNAKEDLEHLHGISNDDSKRRKEFEKAKIQQKGVSQTQPETQPDKE